MRTEDNIELDPAYCVKLHVQYDWDNLVLAKKIPKGTYGGSRFNLLDKATLKYFVRKFPMSWVEV